MANLVKESIVTNWTTALASSTDLDSKTTTTAIAVGAVVANDTGLALLMDLSLLLGSVNPSGNPYWEVHLLPLLHDASTYADRSSQTLRGVIQVTTGSSAKASPLTGIPLLPGAFKIQLVNQMGVTSAASGNAFQYRTYCFNANA